MNSTVKKVFMLIGMLVLIFLIWQLVFNDNGIVVTAYNAMATGVNAQFEKATGTNSQILPLWGESDAENNGTGFDIGTGQN